MSVLRWAQVDHPAAVPQRQPDPASAALPLLRRERKDAMTDSRLRLAAQAVADLTGPFMGDEHRAALKALRRALAEHAEEPGVPSVDECERIAFNAGVEAAAKWHDDLGADDTPHGARGHAWYASQIRALAAPVEAHGDAPDGYCPKCRADICAQLAAAYDAGRESVEVAAALAIDAAVEKFIKREDAHAPLVENRPALLALRNVRMLVRRKWGKGIDEEWAEHLIRFCREGGLTDDILRAPRPDDGKTGGGK